MYAESPTVPKTTSTAFIPNRVVLHASKGLGFAHGQMLVRMDAEDPLKPVLVDDMFIPDTIKDAGLSGQHQHYPVAQSESAVAGRVYGILDLAVDSVTGASYRIRSLSNPKQVVRSWRKLNNEHLVMKEEHAIWLSVLTGIAYKESVLLHKNKNMKTNEVRKAHARPHQRYPHGELRNNIDLTKVGLSGSRR